MGKRNKIRYTATAKPTVAIELSGNVYLQYRDDEAVADTHKGDLLCYAECKALHTNFMGEYERTGFVGYFKLDVYDGKAWQPVLLNDIFTEREHHFSKTERSLDTFLLCQQRLQALRGKRLVRTYREHYELEATDE